MARRIEVEIVGDSRQLTRAFSSSTRSAKKFNSEISHMGRGVASGTGLFRGFARSLAFASGGFVAFEGLTSILRLSVDAARDAAVAQRALGAQMKASGESFSANREQIEKTARSYGRFGFQNDEVIASLTVLERGTGKIDQALRLQGLAADIARAKNIDLSAAATTVAKVFGGQETALRRAVPGLSKTAHGWDLIRAAQAKVAGQAAANTTASERFAAQLHDTEEVLGGALLPTLNTYLEKLSLWMSDTRNQAKLQRGVTAAVKDTTAALGLLGTAFGIAAKAASDYQRFAKFAERHTLGPFRRVVRDTLQPGALLSDVSALLGGGGGKKVRMPPGALGPITRKMVEALDKGIGDELAKPQKGPSGKLINRWFDARIGRMIDRVQDAPLRVQLGRLRKIAALLTQRIAVTKDITRKLDLEDTLVSVRRQRKAVAEQLQQQIADARAEEQAKAAERAQKALAARQARQFRLLGFGPQGEDPVPGLRNLRRQLAAVRNVVEGSFLDTRKTRGLLGHIREVLSGSLGAVGAEVRQKIAEILANLREQLKKNRVDVTRFQQANPSAILAALGINLPRAQRRRLELALAGIGSGGRVPSFSGQFGGAGALNVYGGVHLHGVQNVGQLENELAKRAKQRARQRRSTR